MKPGKCPARESNQPTATFDKMSMAGLWFEYVWDSGFTQGHDYKCSTWIVLSDEADHGEGNFVIYNNMLFPALKEDGEHEQDFVKFRMLWDAKSEEGQRPRASYQRSHDEPDDDQGAQKETARTTRPETNI